MITLPQPIAIVENFYRKWRHRLIVMNVSEKSSFVDNIKIATTIRVRSEFIPVIFTEAELF